MTRGAAVSPPAKLEPLLSDSARAGYLSARALQLILMPTEQCNFRCPYCFEDFGLGRMKRGVIDGVKRLIVRRVPELQRLTLDWFGGEPLLAADIIDEIQSHARGLVGRRPGLQFHCSMTTNGYLLDGNRLSRLLSLGVTRFQVALDGTARVHDRKRRLAGGGATFDRIWANLAAARGQAERFRILVRFQVDRETRETIDEFLDLYAATFGADDRFELGFAQLTPVNPSPREASRFLEGTELASTLHTAKSRAARRGLRLYGSANRPVVCHATMGNSFIVRSDGSLSKCAVALSHPENRVGRLLEDGRVRIDGPRINGWMRGLWSDDEIELGCPMIGLADAMPELALTRPNVPVRLAQAEKPPISEREERDSW